MPRLRLIFEGLPTKRKGYDGGELSREKEGTKFGEKG
jgi:hypothetical protein